MTAHKTAKIAAARAVAAAMRAAQAAVTIAEARTMKAKKNFQAISRLTA